MSETLYACANKKRRAIELTAALVFFALTGPRAGAATPIIVADGLNRSTVLALDGNDIYFHEDTATDGALKKVAKSGGPISTLASGTVLFDSGFFRGINRIDFDATRVYAGYGGYEQYRIIRLPKTGGLSETVASPNGGGDFIGVIGSDIYYLSGFCCINKRPIIGGQPEIVLGNNWVRSSAVDSNSIYFAEFFSRDVRRFDVTTRALTSLISSNPVEGSIFIDTNNVYLNISGSIKRVPKNGGPVANVVTSSTALGLVSDGMFVYFTENGNLKRVSVNGGAATTIAQGVSIPSMAVDEFFVYWIDLSGGLGAGKILKLSRSLDTPPQSPTITSLTLFSADSSGAAPPSQIAQIWNTQPTDGIWVLGVAAGTNQTAPLLNNPNTTVNLSLGGEQNFTLFGNQNPGFPVFQTPGQFFGLNIFFNGSSTPGISAIGQLGSTLLQPNFSTNTIARTGFETVAGAGTLVFTPTTGEPVTLTQLSIPGLTGVNRVGRGEVLAGFDDLDGVVSITLSTSREGPPPPPPLQADLVVKNLSVNPTSGPAGSQVIVSFGIRNQGSGAANASTTNIRLSTSSTNVTTSDPLLASISTPSIAAGENLGLNHVVTIPSVDPGGHFVWVIVDVNNTANQADTTNDRMNTAFNVTLAGAIDLVDPISELLAGQNITTDINSLATKGIVREGVAADGVAKLVIRFNAPGAGRVDFFLANQDGQPLANRDEDGLLTDLQGAQTDSFVSVSTRSTSEGHKAFALYSAPSTFVRASVAGDLAAVERHVFIRTRFVLSIGQVIDGQPVSVNILRPPLVLVHGIWSSREAWANFDPLITDPRFFIRRVDYREVNDREFAIAADRVYTQIKEFLLQYRSRKNVAALQADLVTHSMGGPVIRTRALRDDFLDDSSFPTFGKGPVRKLITIAGVHLGTRMANLLLENECVADIFTNELGRPTGNGAVTDLADGSAAVQRINAQQTPFPVHTVVGLASGLQKAVNGAEIQRRIDWRCRGNVFRGFNDILGPDNDLLVAAHSQSGGHVEPATSFIPIPVVHSEPFAGNRELETRIVAERVSDLLNTGEFGLFRPLP